MIKDETGTLDMNHTLIRILQSIQTLHTLEKEFATFFGRFRFRDKKKCKKLKGLIRDKIKELYKDTWTADYLKKLQRSIKAYYMILEDYLDDQVRLLNDDGNVQELKIFSPMEFVNPDDENIRVILDVRADNITLQKINTITGSVEVFEYAEKISLDQKKLEVLCKKALILMLLEYLG